MEKRHVNFLIVVVAAVFGWGGAARACPCQYTAAQVQAAQSGGEPLPRSCACETDGIKYSEDDGGLSACGTQVSGLQVILGMIERHGNDPSLLRRRQTERDGLISCLAYHRAQLAKQQEQAKLLRARKSEIARMSDLVTAGHDNPVIMQIVDSGNICSASADRATALAAIADEKLYAKKVGVVNLRKLEELKEDLREADRELAAANADLRRFDRKALACSNAKLADLQFCYSDQSPADQTPVKCADDDMRVTVAIFGEQP